MIVCAAAVRFPAAAFGIVRLPADIQRGDIMKSTKQTKPLSEAELSSFDAVLETVGKLIDDSRKEWKNCATCSSRGFCTKSGKRLVIGIDGRCGSGKSTLAGIISEKYGDGKSITVSTDDFFLPKELRTPERLAKPGGNVHYERFDIEIEPHIYDRKAFEYRAFDCSIMTYGQTKHIDEADILIIEGTYSLRPEWQFLYDLSIFVTASCETQISRILGRSNKAALESFTSLWIPLEEKYFDAFAIRDSANIVVCTDAEQQKV